MLCNVLVVLISLPSKIKAFIPFSLWYAFNNLHACNIDVLFLAFSLDGTSGYSPGILFLNSRPGIIIVGWYSALNELVVEPDSMNFVYFFIFWAKYIIFLEVNFDKVIKIFIYVLFFYIFLYEI